MVAVDLMFVLVLPNGAFACRETEEPEERAGESGDGPGEAKLN